MSKYADFGPIQPAQKFGGDRPISLTDFLLARIAERESDVRDRTTYAVGHADHCIFEGGYEGTGTCDCGAVTRVMADCGAKRRLVDEFLKQREHNHSLAVNLTTTDSVLAIAAAVTGGLDFACHVTATAYADHPDYREEWRP